MRYVLLIYDDEKGWAGLSEAAETFRTKERTSCQPPRNWQ
jgi:hypothetical protein